MGAGGLHVSLFGQTHLLGWLVGCLFRKRTEYRPDEESSLAASKRIPAVGPIPSGQRQGKSKGSRSQSVFRCLVRRRGYQAAVRAATRRLSDVTGRILDQRIGATGQRIESAPTLFIGRATSLAKQPVRESGWNVEINSLNTRSITTASRV